jgi:hypothetical protein
MKAAKVEQGLYSRFLTRLKKAGFGMTDCSLGCQAQGNSRFLTRLEKRRDSE